MSDPPFTNFASTVLLEERQQINQLLASYFRFRDFPLHSWLNAEVFTNEADQKLPSITKEALILSRSERSCQKIFQLQPGFVIWWYVVHNKSEPVEPGTFRSPGSH